MIKRIFFEAIQYLGTINLEDTSVDLDNFQEISVLDTEQMFEMVYSWPELIENVLRFSIEIPYKNHYSKI